MKKISICLMMLILSATVFCQQPHTFNMTKEDYLTKSKNQKVGGFLLVGLGVAILSITAISVVSNMCLGGDCPKQPPHTFPITLGAVSMASSIPLFIAAERNKRKAMTASASFKFENIKLIQRGGICIYTFPAVSLKINL